jgi:hypothetical protein
MSISFALTYDYRCPFARNVHEHVVAGLRGGAEWDVDFAPFTLSQIHTEEGDLPVWEDPARVSDLYALEASMIVADRYPERFLDVHEALFAARHDLAKDLREADVVLDILRSNDVDADQVAKLIEEGSVREELGRRHSWAANDFQVFGVPTFIIDGKAAFVRLMTRPNGDSALAKTTIDRIIDHIVEHPELNEIKHTTVAQ